MKTSRLLIVAFLLLAVGVFLIANYTHGDAGFSVAVPVAGTKISLNINTTGWPALVGVPSLIFGMLFLILAFLSAIGKEILLRRARKTEPAVYAPLE